MENAVNNFSSDSIAISNSGCANPPTLAALIDPAVWFSLLGINAIPMHAVIQELTKLLIILNGSKIKTKETLHFNLIKLMEAICKAFWMLHIHDNLFKECELCDAVCKVKCSYNDMLNTVVRLCSAGIWTPLTDYDCAHISNGSNKMHYFSYTNWQYPQHHNKQLIHWNLQVQKCFQLVKCYDATSFSLSSIWTNAVQKEYCWGCSEITIDNKDFAIKCHLKQIPEGLWSKSTC